MPTSAAPDQRVPLRNQRPLRAVMLRLVAAALLATSFALAKLAAGRGAHIVELIFYRQLVSLPLVAAWIAATIGLSAIRTSRLPAHATRAALGMGGMALNYLAVILLPLPEATTIGFTMPIFGTIFSALLLREATGWHRWGAVLVGFLGVLVIVRPGGLHMPMTGALVAIAAAVLTALISIYLRSFSQSEDSAVIVFWFSALSLPPLLLAMLVFGRAHDAQTWAILLALGITGGLAQLFLTGSLRWGPVSLVLPMDYSAILWATALGFLFWGSLPARATWAGALLIIGSGLYIVWREHVRLRHVRSAVSAAAVD
jgi:drug/metabolite transporter (DMT)-like permease